MSERKLKVSPRCRDCGEPCIDAGPGLGWQCVRPNCYEEHHGPIHTKADLELTRLRQIEQAAREVVTYSNYDEDMHASNCDCLMGPPGPFPCNCDAPRLIDNLRLALGEKGSRWRQ